MEIKITDEVAAQSIQDVIPKYTPSLPYAHFPLSLLDIQIVAALYPGGVSAQFIENGKIVREYPNLPFKLAAKAMCDWIYTSDCSEVFANQIKSRADTQGLEH
jgi:hypothetical protein